METQLKLKWYQIAFNAIIHLPEIIFIGAIWLIIVTLKFLVVSIYKLFNKKVPDNLGMRVIFGIGGTFLLIVYSPILLYKKIKKLFK